MIQNPKKKLKVLKFNRPGKELISDKVRAYQESVSENLCSKVQVLMSRFVAKIII